MTTRYRVALLGFSAFERSALESYFRLAPEDGRHHTHYDLLPDIVPSREACNFVLADANHAEVRNVVAAAGRAADTVYVGTPHAPPAPPDALADLPRPIDPLQVRREFDAAVERRSRQPAAAAATPVRRYTARARQHAEEQAARQSESGDFSQSVLLGGEGGDGMFDQVLVVDDSEIARRFLQMKLQRLGYTVDTAASGHGALQMVATRRYAFVFLDVAMEGIDGFETCKHIKHMPWPLDERMMRGPVVVMVTGRSGSVDRIRGALAGCDAYLTKPLNEDELIATLSKYDDSFERVFENTVPPLAHL
ncbi:response regulator [Methylibium rhizosphaerae]|uniref:response regulator n=1 Tax=Methylibium rhizosphaerae TaxID=2570323 RepID=UPI0011288D93|nr:response regulator [Methylibium rhizosphaerae]